MSTPDQIQRVLFDNADVRGVVVGLEESYQQAIAYGDYPDEIRHLLGEMLAAVVLLSSNLKIEGRLSLQAQGDSGLRLLLAECNNKGQVRAIARFDEETLKHGERFDHSFVNGRMALTMEPEQGQRYQGIVPLEGATVAECIEGYFRQSEQLPTQLILTSNGQRAAGMMLQVLPAAGNGDEDWNHISTLAQTLQNDELLELDNETLLYRLFHQESARITDPETLTFSCDCSRQRSAAALQTMTEEELLSLAEEHNGVVSTTCHFCNRVYDFDAQDIKALFHNDGALNESDSLH